jgi:hypothetical protein
MAKVICYAIESGWEEAPTWYCEVEYRADIEKAQHLHTTPYLGAAPSVFSGRVSGLVFLARGSSYPIESRSGTLLIVESEIPLGRMTNWQQSSLDWRMVTEDEVILLLTQ